MFTVLITANWFATLKSKTEHPKMSLSSKKKEVILFKDLRCEIAVQFKFILNHRMVCLFYLFLSSNCNLIIYNIAFISVLIKLCSSVKQ